MPDRNAGDGRMGLITLREDLGLEGRGVAPTPLLRGWQLIARRRFVGHGRCPLKIGGHQISGPGPRSKMGLPNAYEEVAFVNDQPMFALVGLR